MILHLERFDDHAAFSELLLNDFNQRSCDLINNIIDVATSLSL